MKNINMLDKLVNYVSPVAGAKRLAARRVANITARYEGAKKKDGWQSVGTSANSEIGRDLKSLRNVSRDLCRNSPYGARMLEVFSSIVIGDGITPAALGDDDAAKKLMSFWDEWAGTTACDASGMTDFAGLQTLAARSVFESGEVLIRRRDRRPKDGLPVPLQLQLLEADHLDDITGTVKNSLDVDIQGVRFSATGKILGYHIFTHHPGDNIWAAQRKSAFVDAKNISHIFAKQRPGQVRGVPRGHAIYNLLRDMDEYREARLLKSKIEATLAIFVGTQREEQEDGTRLGLSAQAEAEPRNDMVDLAPGMVHYGRPGETIETINASSTSDGNALHRTLAQESSVGFGTTYDQTTGDVSQANYSSLKAGGIVQRRIASQIQKQVFIPLFCRPAWRWFVEAGELNNSWQGSSHKAKWVPSANEKIDPKKDMEADALELASGLSSWADQVQSRGHDPREKFDELQKEIQRFRDAGMKHPMDTEIIRVSENSNENNAS
ncbi:phage portal protein [Kiloniella sp.]|uniref:phage portal protein n=1 Tax=Kiloniella sp. TaxID=1938587 RepID=UPI003B02C514